MHPTLPVRASIYTRQRTYCTQSSPATSDSAGTATPTSPSTLEEVSAEECEAGDAECCDEAVDRIGMSAATRDDHSSSSTTATEDSAVFSSGLITPSRRDSDDPQPLHGGVVGGRRHTISNKLPLRRYTGGVKAIISGVVSSSRKDSAISSSHGKTSIDSQVLDYDSEDEADEHYGRTANHRRLSVPEKTFRKANYAILRKSFDEQIEIIGVFQRCTTDAYKEFLQSLTCYDVTPPHGVVVMLDARLTIHKAVTIMCLNTGHKAAVVCKPGSQIDDVGIFTITDCLLILKLAASGESPELGEKPLLHYMETIQPRKQLITACCSMTCATGGEGEEKSMIMGDFSAWDVARLFRLNRVHRIPVFQFDLGASADPSGGKHNEVFSLICLRAIFIEILKLLDSTCALMPDLRALTLEQTRVGNWKGIASLDENASVQGAVEQFLERRAPCLPLFSNTSGNSDELVGVVTKSDVIDALAQRSTNYLEVLALPVKAIIEPERSCIEISIEPHATIEATIRRMVVDSKTCLFVAREGRLEGVVSLADVMDYLLSASGI